jgi:Family of unknown function (DUF6178)
MSQSGRGRDAGASPRNLLARILDSPRLARAVPRLSPEVLHRVIRQVGLEDCGDLLAFVTSEQLSALLDLDLWRGDEPGRDERFDADRFGAWLEALAEHGPDRAARALASIDPSLVTAALSHHVAVCDPAAVALSAEMDVDESPVRGGSADRLRCDVGGYMMVAKRSEFWDTIVAVLVALDEGHADCFHQVMRGCRTLSSSAPEADGFHDLLTPAEQIRFDLAIDRERRREERGYVTPPQAHAFLQAARQSRRGAPTAPAMSPIFAAYLRGLVKPSEAVPPGDIAGASQDDGSGGEAASAEAALVDVLQDAGVLPGLPRPLLDGAVGSPGPLARIRAQLAFVRERDPAVYLQRTGELAFLANVLVVGCPLQSRPFTAQEGSDAAAAICNLGLEHRPELPEDFLVGHDLVGAFETGWSVLHRDVCLFAAERLLETLTQLRCRDREAQLGLARLRSELARYGRLGEPWRARDQLNVIATLDLPAWAALGGLIAECPVLLANVDASRRPHLRAVDVSAFEFVSSRQQIESVREFMRSLAESLVG